MNCSLERYCRICCKVFKDDCLVSIFDAKTKPIDKIIKFNSFLQIAKNDGLPQNICRSCITEFNQVYNFITKCEKNQMILESKFNKLIESSNDNHVDNDLADTIDYEEYFVVKSERDDSEEIEYIYEADFLDEYSNDNETIVEIDEYSESISSDKNVSKSETIEGNKFSCKICAREFRSQAILTKHISLSICKSTSAIDTNDEKLFLQNHIKNKSSTNSYRHKKFKLTDKVVRKHLCITCGKEFNKKQNLDDHENVHRGLRPYSCHLCDKSFSFKQILKNHIAKHADNHTYNCDVCNKTFTSKQYFTDHKKRHESGVLLPNCEKLYKCPHCPKTFKMLATLNSHCNYHSKPTESKYNCSDCGAIFKRSDHLKEHVNAVHLNIKPFPCDICDKKFVTGAHRNAHKRKFHSGKRFKCDLCEKDFSLNTSLTRHKRIHSGDKRYKCEICNESFMAIYQIEKHMEQH